MILKTISPIVVLFASFLFTQAQDITQPTKPPVMPDDSVWTSVAIKDLSVTMPAKPFEVQDDTSGAVESVLALTRKGTFTVIIKRLDKQIDSRNTEILVDRIANATLSAKTKLLEKRDVEYEGTRGKQVAYIEDGNRVFARILFLNDRLVVLSASFKQTDYVPEFDTVVDRFFDSIRVKLPLLLA